MKKIAVILSGSGYLDGAEITESVFSFLALDNSDVDYQVFSIDMLQHHVVNHVTGEVNENESRNVLVEAARISRGNIANLETLKVDDFDGLLLTGGFGVGKNFTSFAFDGSNCSINETLKHCIVSFHQHSKPIGAICIAPVVLAISLGRHKPQLTIGHDTDTASEIEKLGAQHIVCSVHDCIVDSVNRLVTTPAYMQADARPKDIYQGITQLVKKMLTMM